MGLQNLDLLEGGSVEEVEVAQVLTLQEIMELVVTAVVVMEPSLQEVGKQELPTVDLEAEAEVVAVVMLIQEVLGDLVL